MGRPDEYFELSEGFIVPFDHKTKSKEPEDVHRSYQLQMDVYSYLLGALDYKTINIAYLAFYYPDECDLYKGMPFHCRILKVKTSPQRVSNLVKKAYDILNSGIPEGKNSCEYCRWTIESSAVEIVEI